MTPWTSRFSAYAGRVVPSAIRALATMPKAADTISFGPGEPDASLFPAERIAEGMARLLASPQAARAALQYATTEGDPALRKRIAGHMRKRGVPCGPQNVMLTNGSQQALDLMGSLLIDPGATVLVQAPTYPGALQVFAAHGAKIADVARFEANGSGRPALVYAMANFQNPTGASLSLEERRRLVALARDLDAVLIEDDPYEVLRYEGEPLPPLLALDAQGDTIEACRSVYLGTFSKSAVPGFRVGWVVAPQAVIEQLALMKQSEDLQAGTLAQACLVEIFDFIAGEHALRLREAYRLRRDTMLAALTEEFGNRASFSVPQGGFFVWLTLPEEIDAGALLPHAAQAGVTYVPGAAFFHDGQGRNTLRLSFSSTPLARIAEGVARLAAVLKAGG